MFLNCAKCEDCKLNMNSVGVSKKVASSSSPRRAWETHRRAITNLDKNGVRDQPVNTPTVPSPFQMYFECVTHLKETAKVSSVNLGKRIYH